MNAGQLAEDWAAIWQSEMAALATDREAQEQVAALGLAWAVAADAAGRAGTDAEAGAAPAPVAPSSPGDGSGTELEHLRRRVAELERAAAGR